VTASAPDLAAEGAVFGRYLTGRTPPADLVARYADAGSALFTAPVSPQDAAVVAFAVRHPWSVAPLDAAAGLLRPGGTLRSKILVMAAILEASPAFADEFLPRASGAVGLFLRLALHGTRAVAQVLVGLPLYWLASRGRA
jgi:hypothetical protein